MHGQNHIKFVLKKTIINSNKYWMLCVCETVCLSVFLP